MVHDPLEDEENDGTLLNALKARMLLSECTGRDIWPVELCREKGIPEAWIEELSDCFESGFNSDLQTIYFDDSPVNQFHGIQDLLLRPGETRRQVLAVRPNAAASPISLVVDLRAFNMPAGVAASVTCGDAEDPPPGWAL